MKSTKYHALFGVKFLLALGVFYFASGLVGRGEGTAWIRANRRKWLSVTLLLAVGVVMLSGWMRGLHVGPNRLLDEAADGVQLEANAEPLDAAAAEPDAEPSSASEPSAAETAE